MLSPAPRILIADDDEIMRLLIRQFLERQGYQVVEAEDGRAALEKLSQSAFDLIILDMAMPGIDGPGVCAHIRAAMNNPPPVLMVTALDDEASVDRAYKAGAEDYISKPLHWPVLKNRIRHILGAYRARQELELLSRNYEMILDAAANGICGIDAEGGITYINPIALRMLGYDGDEEVRGKHYSEIFRLSQPGSDSFAEQCCPFFSRSEIITTTYFDEARLQRKDGTCFPVDFCSTPIRQNNQLIGGVLIFHDITERQEAAELIRHMANHDALTNLPNRNNFNRRLPQAVALAERCNRILCLLFIDLDRFKPINDEYGHTVGDMVLTQVADRLRLVLRASDSVYRLGGDEFVILLESTGTVEGATTVAQKVIDSLGEPISARGHLCFIGASIGISVYPDDCDDAETMLRHADIAMYDAKKRGRNRWRLYQQFVNDPEQSS